MRSHPRLSGFHRVQREACGSAACALRESDFDAHEGLPLVCVRQHGQLALIAMRLSAVAAALAAVLIAGLVFACGEDESSDGETDGTGGGSTYSDPYDEYFSQELAEASTDAPPPSLPDPALQALVDELAVTVRVNHNAAAALSEASGSPVAPVDVANVESIACQQGADAAVTQFTSLAPGVDLAVLPNVNEMSGEMAKLCGQPAADAFSGRALAYLLSNTSAAPESVEPATTDLSLMNQAACRGLKAGLANRISKWLRIRGAGRYGVSLAVGAALTDCPETLDEILNGS